MGAISRYTLGQRINKPFERLNFPISTFFVYLLGCILIGLISETEKDSNFLSQELQMFILVGFLGTLTTFSSLGFETSQLYSNGFLLNAFLNITLNIVLGFVGLNIGKVYLAKIQLTT